MDSTSSIGVGVIFEKIALYFGVALFCGFFLMNVVRSEDPTFLNQQCIVDKPLPCDIDVNQKCVVDKPLHILERGDIFYPSEEGTGELSLLKTLASFENRLKYLEGNGGIIVLSFMGKNTSFLEKCKEAEKYTF
jgi:hypothetical protein